MPTLTLTARELVALTAPVLPHVGKDDTLPLLSAVLIRTRGEYVTCTGTDRYRLAYQRIKPTPQDVPEPTPAVVMADVRAGVPSDPPPAVLDPDFALLLPRETLASIGQVFKPTRYNDPVLRLTVDTTTVPPADGDKRGPHDVTTLTVEAASGLFGMESATLRFTVQSATAYPATDRLLRTAVEAAAQVDAQAAVPAPVEPRAAFPVTVNRQYLADFAKGHADRYEPVVVTQGGHPASPILIRVGEDFIGALVPMRLATREHAKPVTEWLDVLDAPKVPVPA